MFCNDLDYCSLTKAPFTLALQISPSSSMPLWAPLLPFLGCSTGMISFANVVCPQGCLWQSAEMNAVFLCLHYLRHRIAGFKFVPPASVYRISMPGQMWLQALSLKLKRDSLPQTLSFRVGEKVIFLWGRDYNSQSMASQRGHCFHGNCTPNTCISPTQPVFSMQNNSPTPVMREC